MFSISFPLSEKPLKSPPVKNHLPEVGLSGTSPERLKFHVNISPLFPISPIVMSIFSNIVFNLSKNVVFIISLTELNDWLSTFISPIKALPNSDDNMASCLSPISNAAIFLSVDGKSNPVIVETKLSTLSENIS